LGNHFEKTDKNDGIGTQLTPIDANLSAKSRKIKTLYLEI